MRFLFIFLTCLLLYCGDAHAIWRKHKYTGQPRTEGELMNKIMDCLKTKDSISYYHLFPPFDTLWKMVLHNPNQSPEAVKELNHLREHPTVLIDLDPFYNHSIIRNFTQTIHKGEDSGVQWRGIVMLRYELQHQGLTRGMEGLQLIAPERFKGFLFVRDMLSSTTYCITVTEIQKVNGFYCGGQVLNVLEASDIDQYIAKESAERKYMERMRRLAESQANDGIRLDSNNNILMEKTDSVTADSIKMAKAGGQKVDSAKIKREILLSSPVSDDDASRLRREVVARKYYKGKFDEEIPVELYIRYMKDAKDKVTNYWDALYKFGDMAEYVKLDVSKTPEDKWLFEEPVATIELELNGKTYIGSWTNGQNQTGYDAELLEKEISQKKISELDRILENGTWGQTDQQKITEKKDTTESAEGGGKSDGKNKDGKKITRAEKKQIKEKAREEEKAAQKKADEAAEKEAKRAAEEAKKEDEQDDEDTETTDKKTKTKTGKTPKKDED